MDKKARDNRANQLNPNNEAYYKSRMGNKNSNKSKTNSQKNHQQNHSTKVYHNHYHQSKPDNNLGRRCPLCGRAGKLTVGMFGYKMHCGYCGGSYKI